MSSWVTTTTPASMQVGKCQWTVFQEFGLGVKMPRFESQDRLLTHFLPVQTLAGGGSMGDGLSN